MSCDNSWCRRSFLLRLRALSGTVSAIDMLACLATIIVNIALGVPFVSLVR